jgi:hypothetical protein
MTAKRSVWALIALSVLWFLIFWLGGLFLMGFIVGMVHPDNAGETAKSLAAIWSAPIFLLSLLGAPILVGLGYLPGSSKKFARNAKTECVIDYAGLDRLVALHKDGHLTDDEFGRQKTSILRKCD